MVMDIEDEPHCLRLRRMSLEEVLHHYVHHSLQQQLPQHLQVVCGVPSRLS